MIEVRKSLDIGRTQLCNAINGSAKSAGGYAWCKVEDYKNFKLEEHIDTKKKSVICLENQIEFDSIKLAAEWIKENNYSSGKLTGIISNISRACKNQIKAYKFSWSYI